MPAISRFERIAQDLEKLPCELHDTVLKDLEFEQLIRLSVFAGPRLNWSLENSLSPWGKHFREGNTSRLQALLGITAQVRKFCFQLPKSRKTDRVRSDTWPPLPLHFLHHRGSDWSSARATDSKNKVAPAYRTTFADSRALVNHWLRSLNEIVIETTREAFQVNYSRLIEPWVSEVEGAASLFEKVQPLGQVFNDDFPYAKRKRNAISIDELKDFITFYQQLRQLRTEALVKELCRLADLYEAHPTRLKMPFAPERRRLNEKHVPTRLRIEARKMTKRVANTWWKDKEIYKYRFEFPFPALVPYSWTLQLFDKVLRSEHAVLSSVEHKEIFEKARTVSKSLPPWAAGAPNMEALTQQVERWAPKYRTKTWDRAYQPHRENELKWLELFGELIAWMEVQFPGLFQVVRGPGWVVGAKS